MSGILKPRRYKKRNQEGLLSLTHILECVHDTGALHWAGDWPCVFCMEMDSISEAIYGLESKNRGFFSFSGLNFEPTEGSWLYISNRNMYEMCG